MKIMLIILAIIISQQSLACSCMAQSPLTKLATSEFVAKVKILNVTPDPKNSHYNDVDIEILELYKGDKVSSLKNNGTDESMCGLYTPKNTIWLIYAYRHNDGYLRYGLCSGSKQLDKKVNSYKYSHAQMNYKKLMDSNLELLKYLKDENVDLNDVYELRTRFSNECLKYFNGTEVKTHRFALYKLTIDSDLNIKIIEAIKEFDNEDLQENLHICLNKSVKAYKNNYETKIPINTKIILGLFYNPAVDENESFISQWSFGY